MLLAWVVLLPNAGYLVTELNLNHRREGEDVPLWYDIVAVLTLAMSGVLNTVVNVFLAASHATRCCSACCTPRSSRSCT